MILDREEHRILLQKMMETSSFQGPILELALDLKRAINTAQIADQGEKHGEKGTEEKRETDTVRETPGQPETVERPMQPV